MSTNDELHISEVDDPRRVFTGFTGVTGVRGFTGCTGVVGFTGCSGEAYTVISEKTDAPEKQDLDNG